MRHGRIAVAVGLLLAACDDRLDSPPAEPEIPAVAQRIEPARAVAPTPVAVRSPVLVDAQAVIEETCGGCHRSDLETAVPEALAVFDLWDPQWLARLDALQHESMIIRLEDQGIPASDVERVRAAIAEVQARPSDPDCTQS